MSRHSGIRSGQSCAVGASDAVREFHAAVRQPDMALVVFSCSNACDLDTVAAETRSRFDGVEVDACSYSNRYHGNQVNRPFTDIAKGRHGTATADD